LSDIFISYRSSDEPFAALGIDQALTARFGAHRVFRDTRSMGPGSDFSHRITQALAACRVLVAVIGDGWLMVDAHGRRRIEDPHDYVRREIAVALARGVTVIPALIGDALMPPPDVLPAALAGLTRRQFVRLRARGADDDLRTLTDALVTEVGGALDDEPVKDPRDEVLAGGYHFHGAISGDGHMFGPHATRHG
jgi:hypothetical protein